MLMLDRFEIYFRQDYFQPLEVKFPKDLNDEFIRDSQASEMIGASPDSFNIDKNVESACETIEANEIANILSSNDLENQAIYKIEETVAAKPVPLTPTEGRKSLTNQKMRLPQFSIQEVTKAIEDSKNSSLSSTVCIKCGFLATNIRALSVHMTHIHKDLKDQWCSQCNVMVENSERHKKSHRLVCPFCVKDFAVKSHFTEHLRSHSDVRPYECDQCSKNFISSRHLKVHYRTHTKEKPYTCELCGKTFNQLALLKGHLKNYPHFSCAACTNNFESELALQQHECSEDEEKTVDEVEQVGNDRRDFLGEIERMKQIISTSQNYCKTCDRRVRSLSKHEAVVHKKSRYTNEPKLCNMCGKQFRNMAKLNVHMRTHTGLQPYKCTYCLKEFSTRSQMVVHERTHTGQKPYKCKFCTKAFAQSSVLNIHMRLHVGRPEVCVVCKKTFCRKTELKLHMRRHTGEKPYLCTECGQSFIQRSHLTEHSKIHTDQRPFKCSHCGRGFKQSSSLKTHIHIHMGKKPFKCSKCSYSCRQSYSLKQHMKLHEIEQTIR